MANATFYLRKGNDKIEQPIYLRYRITPEIDFKFPIKIKALPKHWDYEKERIKNVIAVPERQIINEYLNELAQAVENYKVRTIAKRETITVKSLREFLNEYLTPTNAHEKTLFGFIGAYIEESKTRVNAKTGKKLSRFPIVAYGTLLSNLKEFSKEKRKQVDFGTIDLDFYTDFTEFLSKKGLAVNTIAKKITTLKAILNIATDKGINKNLAYKSKRFTAITEESDNIYLNETELLKIADLDLTGNKRLERVKDLFLLGAYTGLRFGDFTRITSANIVEVDEVEQIQIHQSKTSAKVHIPLHPIAKEILERNGGKAPQAITNQKMNDYLKEVGQMAGLFETVSKTITKGGKQISANRHKWELLSTHTARRSFATNLYKTGFPAQSIMKITGHKTEKAFLKYIKVTGEENANMLALHWKRHTKLKIA